MNDTGRTCRHCNGVPSRHDPDHEDRCPILMPCPYCGAMPGVACITKSGRPVWPMFAAYDADRSFHMDRVRLAGPRHHG